MTPQTESCQRENSLLCQVGRNAYRTLGLPADASSRVIYDRVAALRRAVKAGIAPSSPWNFEWYGPLQRDGNAISAALARLSNPYQRLRERFFWIAQPEAFAARISSQGFDACIKALSQSNACVDVHNAGVLALISCFSNDPNVKDPKRWEKALGIWVDATSSEEFWSEFLKVEQSGDFEPAACLEDINELRANSPKLVTEPIAELARDPASRGDFERCGRALQIIRGGNLPPEIVTGVEEDVLGPYEDAFNRLSKEISKHCWSEIKRDGDSANANKKPSSIAQKRWEQELKPKYEQFVAMAGSGSVPYLRLTDEYASFLGSIGNALTWADWWVRAEELLTNARDLLKSDSPARERIQTSLRNVAGVAARQRLQGQSGARCGSHGARKAGSPKTGQRNPERPGADPTTSEQQKSKLDDVSRFLKLCEAIQTESWKEVQHGGGHPQNDHACFKAAYSSYRRQAEPWLALILANYRDDKAVSMRVRKAAAECLCSLAGGFICARDLDTAQAIAQEAHALVSGDTAAEREIQFQLELIASERQKSEADFLKAAHSLAAFCDLCSSLQSKCWETPYANAQTQKVKVGLVLTEYRCEVAPWLEIILARYHGDINILRPVQNAAASCLSSLARAFLLVNDLDYAHRLAVEAPALVLEQEQLEREIKDCLRRIVVDRERIASNQRGISPDRKPAAKAQNTRALEMTDRAAASVVAISVALFIGIATFACVNESSGKHSQQRSPANRSGSGAFAATRYIPDTAAGHSEAPLSNGADLAGPIDTNGTGTLAIDNYSGMDAAIKIRSLAFAKLTVRFVYVKALNHMTVNGIPHGDYVVQISTGRDWDRSDCLFRRDQSFVQFKNRFSFQKGDNSNVKNLVFPAEADEMREITPEEFTAGAGQQ